MDQRDIVHAVQDRDIDTITLCIDNHDIDISETCIWYEGAWLSLLEWACATGNIDVVKQIMKRSKTDTRINPAADDNDAFRWACRGGHTDTGKYIMSLAPEYPDINPAAYNNYAFQQACECGHTDTAKYIMSLASEYPDINPAADNNEAFLRACWNGHIDTAKYIMSLAPEYPDINPAARNNEAFLWVLHTYHTDMIRYLLTMSVVRQAIKVNENVHHKKYLRKWIKSCVKHTLYCYVSLEAWRLDSVYRVFLSLK